MAKFALSLLPILQGFLTTAALASQLSAFAGASGAATALGGLPLFFEANRGQSPGNAAFLARGHNCYFAIEPTRVQFLLCENAPKAAAPLSKTVSERPRPFDPVGSQPGDHPTLRGCAATVEFLDACSDAQVFGAAEQPGKLNYFIGSDPAQWRAGVATYAQVRVVGLYPGIDLTYYGNQRQLEYDFSIAPHADPGLLRLGFQSVDKLSINQAGELVLTLSNGEVRNRCPVLYQVVGGIRKDVAGGYRLIDSRTVGFGVGTYDPDLPLIIDPIFSYSTFFGGNGGEAGYAVKVDPSGNVYLCGETLSTSFLFPIPINAFQRTFGGGGINGDAFLAKLDSTGTNLVYFTYLGGNSEEAAYDLALDSAGNAYLAGFTTSSNFPTKNALYSQIRGVANPLYPNAAFVAELNTNGSALVYSTYLAGTSNDVARAVAVDPAGNTYVAGYTYSMDFPITNAFQSTLAGVDDVFVAKIAPGGTRLVYSTFLGGVASDEAAGIAVDAKGNAFITGYTLSYGFPVTSNAQQIAQGATISGLSTYDAFLSELGPFGTNLVYSTYLGGSDNDFGYRVRLDPAGNVYVVGATRSLDFATNAPPPAGLTNALLTGGLNYDAFLARYTTNYTTNALNYLIRFGGSGDDAGEDVAIDPAGHAFVVGTTISLDFPVFAPFGLFGTNNSGSLDAFVTAINIPGTNAIYSGYLGGIGNDYGLAIAADAEGSAYAAGFTASLNFPTNTTAFQSTFSGPSAAFLAKIRLANPALTITLQNGNLVLSWPASSPGFALQTASSLLSPVSWTTWPQTPTLSNNLYTVTLAPTNAAAFFRLRQP